VNPPSFDDYLGFFQRVEQLSVEKLIAHLPVKRFASAIFPEGRWLDLERRQLKRVQPVPELARDNKQIGASLSVQTNSTIH
jgi:hypothetical protein